ncbi:MAG: thymidylate synthase [Candidatus Woesearchaeota archaeon]
MVKQYHALVKQIFTSPYSGFKPNRTNSYSISLFGPQMIFDMQEGFPIHTTKKMGIKTIAGELLWFLRGDTNISYLLDHDIHIWDDNAFDAYVKKKGLSLKPGSEQWELQKKEYIYKVKTDVDFARVYGDLGPVYGKQWRCWETANGTIDQIKDVLDMLGQHPFSRRLIVSAWNPAEIKDMALPPCHSLFQFNVIDTPKGKRLDIKLHQRSADIFLGVPFNTVSYSLLLHIIAQHVGMIPGLFIHSFGDAHIYCGEDDRGLWYKDNFSVLQQKLLAVAQQEEYNNIAQWIEQTAPPQTISGEGQDHVPVILQQLSRTCKALPTLGIAKKPILELTKDDFVLEGYEPHPPIKARMAV